MTVNSYLSNLASSLVLSEFEKSKIDTSINTIKSRLNYYFSDIEEKKVFGSYVRGTILPRKDDSESDIDIMVVFSNPYSYKPQTFLNRLKEFAEFYYSSSEIHQSSPTIVLELNHIKFELTPAYTSYGSYYIPDGPSNWMYTNPDGFYSSLTECNSSNSYKIKPVVRLLKHWNIQCANRRLKSFALEKKIAEDMRFSYIYCTSYSDYVKTALGLFQTTAPFGTVDNAISHIDAALAFEKANLPYYAIAEIKMVFPEV